VTVLLYGVWEYCTSAIPWACRTSTMGQQKRFSELADIAKQPHLGLGLDGFRENFFAYQQSTPHWFGARPTDFESVKVKVEWDSRRIVQLATLRRSLPVSG
jgi:hypothetical protein